MFKLFQPKTETPPPRQLSEHSLERLAEYYLAALSKPDPVAVVNQIDRVLSETYSIETINQAKQRAIDREKQAKLAEAANVPLVTTPTSVIPMPPVPEAAATGIPVSMPERIEDRPMPKEVVASKPSKELEILPPEETIDVELLDPLETIALAIAQAYQAHGHNVKPIKGEHRSGFRHNTYTFQKDIKSSFTTLRSEGLKQEILSHAGMNPKMSIIFDPLANNQFHLQIPKTEGEWQIAHLLHCLPRAEEAIRSWKKAETIEGRNRVLIETLRDGIGIGPGSPLRIPFMLDDDGNPVFLDLTSGLLMVGRPNAGKSNAMKVIVSVLMLALPPEMLQFLAVWDLKDGLTLSAFNDCPHFARDVLTEPDPVQIRQVFEELREEKERRNSLMREVRAENIMEYRERTGLPMPWSPILIDEVTKFVDCLSPDGEELLGEGAREWRSAGMPIVGGIQYASKDKGVGPDTRNSFGAIAAFPCTQQAASLAFDSDDSTYSRIAANLSVGECLLKQNSKFYQGQVYWIGYKDGRDHLGDMLKIVKGHYGFRSLYGRDAPVLETKQEPEIIAAPQSSSLVVSNPFSRHQLAERRGEDWEAYKRVVQLFKSSYPSVPTVNSQLEAAFGEKYDDPKKAHRSHYAPNKKKLDELFNQFGHPSNELQQATA